MIQSAFNPLLPGADLIPVGCVLPYAGPLASSDNQSPNNLDEIRMRLAQEGWLYCDGSAYSCQDYWLLYGVIGKAYGGDDQHFNVPDLRGRFLRGVNGDAAAGDPDVEGRIASGSGGNEKNQVGSLQQDAYQGHEHYVQIPTPLSLQPGETPAYVSPLMDGQATTQQLIDSSIPNNDKPRCSTETRPLNLNLNFIIRYR